MRQVSFPAMAGQLLRQRKQPGIGLERRLDEKLTSKGARMPRKPQSTSLQSLSILISVLIFEWIMLGQMLENIWEMGQKAGSDP
ncbi:hypothetical protein JD844_019968 [Phrynosoma platyrhinos]|uniref:Uncharacterized protein n=1 Tax=Phrynosoma platyrhinos TaxID=52577 RepID=A0ABQ7TQA8_PHRPL|nr:hypothetical protein JD844_019968 [Phrynosoma platyrhinos]